MLTVAESARMLGVTPSRVRALIAHGALPARKVGRTWILEEADVVERASLHARPGRPAKATIKPVDDPAGQPASDESWNEELHRLYVGCKSAFRFRPGVEQIEAAQSAEEGSFYVAVADFFLQERQRELVAQGVY